MSATLLPKLSSRDEIRHMHRHRGTVISALLLASCAQPSDRARAASRDTVVVFTASSLALPVRSVLDGFARRTGDVALQENGPSVELARRITELGRVPDLIVLADQEVFPQLLVPKATPWYARFARNRMVIAYTDKSRGASELTPESWRRILLRSDVALGRSDPAIAPVGYRTLLLYRLAESYYHEPGLAAKLQAKTTPAQIRGNASDLLALLSAGELDYIIDYESLARANHLRMLTLPPEIDLGDPARAAEYARASVRVTQRGDSVTRTGAPIMYAASVPRAAPHRAAGIALLAFLLSVDGQALLRAQAVDALPTAELAGDSVPAPIRDAARP